MKNIKKLKRGRTQYIKGDNHYMMYKRKYILIHKNYFVLANLAVKNGLSLIFFENTYSSVLHSKKALMK